MSNVAVQKIRETKEAARPLFGELTKLFDRVRTRAFDLFEKRGCALGCELDDWLEAEREMVWSPPAELIENNKEFQIRIAAPGFEAKDLRVSALPDAIIVQAEARKEEEKKEENVRMSEFRERKLFRRVELPSLIDVEKVTATLDKGMLDLVAAKAEPVTEKKVFVAGGRHAA
jgi:HSP20 family protein